MSFYYLLGAISDLRLTDLKESVQLSVTYPKSTLQNELGVVADSIQNIINENAHTALDQDEYQRKYDGLVERFDTAKAELETVIEQIKDKITRHKNLEIFLDELKNQKGLLKEFDPLLWNSLVDYLTVFEEEKIQATFKNGIET